MNSEWWLLEQHQEYLYNTVTHIFLGQFVTILSWLYEGGPPCVKGAIHPPNFICQTFCGLSLHLHLRGADFHMEYHSVPNHTVKRTPCFWGYIDSRERASSCISFFCGLCSFGTVLLLHSLLIEGSIPSQQCFPKPFVAARNATHVTGHLGPEVPDGFD